jgi:hypothetical protein
MNGLAVMRAHSGDTIAGFILGGRVKKASIVP